jgi:hypothetical protein
MKKHQLISLAETYAEHRGLTLPTVSTYAAGDGKFFSALKGKASCTIARAERLVGWFDANWPADLAWPRDIPRPSAMLRRAG